MAFAVSAFPDRDCRQADARTRRSWGCDGPLPWAIAEIDGVEVFDCPKRPYCEDPGRYAEAFRYVAWYQRGFLPSPGGWRDQTPAFLRCVDVVEAARHKADLVRQEEAEREARAHRRQESFHGGKRGRR